MYTNQTVNEFNSRVKLNNDKGKSSRKLMNTVSNKNYIGLCRVVADAHY